MRRGIKARAPSRSASRPPFQGRSFGSAGGGDCHPRGRPRAHRAPVPAPRGGGGGRARHERGLGGRKAEAAEEEEDEFELSSGGCWENLFTATPTSLPGFPCSGGRSGFGGVLSRLVFSWRLFLRPRDLPEGSA